MKQKILACLLILLSHGALASGDGISIPWSIDPYGGSPAEQNAFYQGNTGILLGRAPWARLFAAWRLLHNLPVGVEAGKSLALPCCGGTGDATDAARKTWVDARSSVPNAKPLKDYEITVFREVGDFFAVPTCFPDAFVTAAATLKQRIAEHGAENPGIKTWLAGQDAVFTACSGDADLPALDPAAPAWLVVDHAYQSAALSLYTRHFDDAERKFAAIAADAASPWQRLAPYLAARAAVDAALPANQPAAIARARERLKALSGPDVFGHAELPRLAGALAFRDQPDLRRTELARMLTAPALPPDVAADFKDARRLGQLPSHEPGFLDWIAVFGRIPDTPEAAWFDHYKADQVWQTDAETLAHARERWNATADFAWLIAAMEWSDPGAASADLVAAAAAVPASHPAFLTALYHQVRLGGFTDPAATRSRLDAALARTDLSLSTRNLLLAERAMLATDLTELARLAPRKSPCLTATDADKGCVGDSYMMENALFSSLRPDIRFGHEAEAIIDHLPTPERAQLADAATLPAALRLDLALTTWVRAALAQDFTAADRLAGLLRVLLPQLDPEWQTYLEAKPGDDKRFAAWFILAKLPGADVDLGSGYTRPQGAVSEFDGHWHDWLYASAGAAAVPPAAVTGDVACFGMCGPGAFPLHLPAFVAAMADRTAQDRGRYLPADAKAARSVWEDLLAYAKAHPADPRSPEALYWLVRISHYGTGHNRSSYRAFVELHKRYPTTKWSTSSKYFYD